MDRRHRLRFVLQRADGATNVPGQLGVGVKVEDLTKRLLASDGILAEPEVVEAYWGLMGNDSDGHDWYESTTLFPGCLYCKKCGMAQKVKFGRHACPIPGSLAEVAFAMRDGCDWYDGANILPKMIDDQNYRIVYQGSLAYLGKSTPTHWIIAATVAWHESKGESDE